jgi:Rrf2 family protein
LAVKLVPTRRTDYGIRALIFLANQTDRNNTAVTSLAKANAIASAMSIPSGFLPQLLQQLQRARLVVSHPGPNGGHALARPAHQITIREIVEALEGPLEASECALRGGPCHWQNVCALHQVWSSARRALVDTLELASLGAVAADEKAIAAQSGELLDKPPRRRPRQLPSADITKTAGTLTTRARNRERP